MAQVIGLRAHRLGAMGVLCLLLPMLALAQNSPGRLTEEARKLVDQGSYRQAVRQLERAVELDPAYAEAYFVLGYAHGRLADHAAAAAAFLTAAELRPAWGEAHRMAARSSANAGQMEVAWEQAIRAQQAGIDMTAEIEILAATSPPPTDFEHQMAAPRLMLAQVDLSQFEGFNENPFARETRTGNSSVGAALGQPASEASRNLTTTEAPNPGDRSAPWASQTGAPMVAESRADLDLLRAELARGLGESLEIGLVRDPEHAEYRLVVEVHNMARSGTDRTGGQAVSNEPKWFQGALVIYSMVDGEEIIRRPLRMTDLRSPGTVRGEITNYVRLLAGWTLDLRR